jgi:hypothetical protein
MPLTNDLSNLAADANALFNSITANSTAITALSVGGQTINSTGISINSTFTNTFTIGTSAYFVANGNVGIGTSTPAGKLQVNGGSANDVGPEIKITGSAGYLDMHNNLSVGSYNNITVEGDKGIIFSSGTANTGSLVIAPWFNGTAGIRITNSGSVGIGISSPTATLHVSGTSNISGNAVVGGSLSSANLSTTTNTVTIGTSAYFVANGNVGIGTSGPGTKLTVAGTITPSADNTHDLGSATLRWANIYTGDLKLSNEGSNGNDVDGTTGKWTIQEGEDSLFIINEKNGKKYKFVLEEI